MSALHPIPSEVDIIVTDCAAIEMLFLTSRADKSAAEIMAACGLSTARFNNARKVLQNARKLVTSKIDITKFRWRVTL